MSAETLAVLSVLLDFDGVAAILGRSADKSLRLYLWRGARSGTMPAPIQLSPARIAWRRSEWESHLANLPRAKYAARVEASDAR